MVNDNRYPEPFRAFALRRLEMWLGRAGRAYAAERNAAERPFWAQAGDASDAPGAVSGLSPWIRTRLLAESEVALAAWRVHGAQAEKFVQEVGWRAYWKGWLEMRPARWDEARRLARAPQSAAVERAIRRAEAGETGIACFDAWVAALREHGWLHNHERMWLASIWIFTLGLPWARGADFFMRHLLDGDCASNTLSWRWVAGLQTLGKHYLARADNIRRFTQNPASGGPFDPRGQLNETAEPLPGDPHPPADARRLPTTRWMAAETAPGEGVAACFGRERDAIVFDPAAPTLWVLHDDDLTAPAVASGRLDQAGERIAEPARVDAVAVLETTHRRAARTDAPLAPGVIAWTAAALRDAVSGIGPTSSDAVHWRVPAVGSGAADRAAEARFWAQVERDCVRYAAGGMRQVACAWMPVGPNRAVADRLVAAARRAGLGWRWWSRDWDRALWPHATHGFFRFRGAIADVLTRSDAVR